MATLLTEGKVRKDRNMNAEELVPRTHTLRKSATRSITLLMLHIQPPALLQVAVPCTLWNT